MQTNNANNPQDDNTNKHHKPAPDTQRLEEARELAPTGAEDASRTPADTCGRPLGVADIIGEFGLYQLSLTLLAFWRYVCVAMMTNSGPLIAPEVEFWCQAPGWVLEQLADRTDNISGTQLLANKCRLPLDDGTNFECSSWTFNTSRHGITITDSFQLVCDRDWLRSAFQSVVSVGVVLASVVLGSISDRHGRNFTIRLSFIISLASGIVSYLADSFLTYALARAACSFGDLGLVVSLTTIIVETLGNKYRGTTCLVVYTGWAIGVMVMPFLTSYFSDYRRLMLFTLACHASTLPWLMTVRESVRWSLVNGYIREAGDELKRIGGWNFWSSKRAKRLADAEAKFDRFKAKFVAISGKRRVLREQEEANMSKYKLVLLNLVGGFSKVGQLFASRELMVTTIMIVWITFVSELLYMLFVMINSDIGDNVELNYAIGGLMEVLATFVSIVMVSKMSRRMSLISTLLSISVLCLMLAFSHQHATASIWVLNMAKLAESNLASLVYVTTTEVFPTNLRQTGFGLAGTLGSLGAVVAPFVRTELTNMIGMTSVSLLLSLLPLIASILIPFFLRETYGLELPDDVDDIECLENLTDQPNGQSDPADNRDRADSNLFNLTRRRGSSFAKQQP